MTNKEIRRQAWELCRENFGLILSATFLLSLISSLVMTVQYYIANPVLALVPSVFMGVLSVIISLGMVRFLLDIWHGETPALSVLFSQKHRFWTYVGYVVLLGLIVLGVSLGGSLLITVFAAIVMNISSVLAQIVVIAAAFVIIIPMLWFVIRFEMALTCMVIRHSYGATECMRIAWRASKGNVWRLFCHRFVLNLPLFAAQALLTGYQTYLMMTGQMLNTVGSLLLNFGSVLITALLSGYIYMGTYALQEQLLEKYFAEHPEQAALEAFNNLFSEDSSGEFYEEEDEYEDIPEDEESKN